MKERILMCVLFMGTMMMPVRAWSQSSNGESSNKVTTSTAKEQTCPTKKVYTCLYKIDTKQQETVPCNDVITIDGDKMYIGQDNIYRLKYYKTEDKGSKTLKTYIAEDGKGIGCFIIFIEDKTNERIQYHIFVAYDSSDSQQNVLYTTRAPEER